VVDRCPHLIDLYGLEERFLISPLIGDNIKRTVFGGAGFLPVKISFVKQYYRKIHLCKMTLL
jgi:hypothetical protein